MSITFDPGALLYAVVEYLKSTKHICEPVTHKPEHGLKLGISHKHAQIYAKKH